MDLIPRAPLKPVDFLILLALLDRDRHGYGILSDIAETSDGQVQLDAGNLYRSLRTLVAKGLVERLERRAAPESAYRRRRYYRLTDSGRSAARAETLRLQALLDRVPVRALLAESGS